jgi:hypothetical protein
VPPARCTLPPLRSSGERDVPDSQLRLITCGGDFHDADHRYQDNIIVYALRAG